MLNTTIREIDAQRLAALTPRQTEVLLMLCKGCSARQIADLLDINIHTVHDHEKALRGKLEVGSRVELAVIAAKAGLV